MKYSMQMGVLALGLLSGCAHLSNTGATAELQRGYEVAQLRAQQAEAALAALTERVEQLERQMQEGGVGGEDLGALSTQVSSVRGVSEENRFDVERLAADLLTVQQFFNSRLEQEEARLAQLESLLGVAAPETPSSSNGTAVASEGESEPINDAPDGEAASAEQRLELALDQLNNGNAAAARGILTGWLKDFPDHDLRAEAQYHLGESHFQQEAFPSAARAFQKVKDEFPESSWAPPAMLRLGESLEKLGKQDSADAFYRGVINTYPDSEAAKKADRKLER